MFKFKCGPHICPYICPYIDPYISPYICPYIDYTLPSERLSKYTLPSERLYQIYASFGEGGFISYLYASFGEALSMAGLLITSVLVFWT
jgi:hypothetical protein